HVQLHLKEIEEDMKMTTKLNKEKKLALQQKMVNLGSDDEEDDMINDDPDPVICSSDKINSVHISPRKKSSNSKSDSSSRGKRQQLSKSVYDHGINKTNIPIQLDFD